MPGTGPQENFFMLISNPRCGSTWLMTSLGRLPDISTDFKFAWLPSYAPHPVHRLLGSGMRSVKNVLREDLPEAPVRGSKLVFDGNRLAAPTERETLFSAFDADIAAVHLHRPYFDSLLSHAARGAVNVAADPAQAEDTTMADALAAKDEIELHGSKVHRPVGLLICDLLVLYLNDLMIAELASRMVKSLFVEFDDIHGRFTEISRQMGSGADEATVEHILSQPITRKLPPLDPDLLPSAGALKEISALLESDFIRRRENGDSIDSVCDFGASRIDVPGLDALISKATGTPGAAGCLTSFLFRKAAIPPPLPPVRRLSRAIRGRRNRLTSSRFPRTLLP